MVHPMDGLDYDGTLGDLTNSTMANSSSSSIKMGTDKRSRRSLIQQ